MKLNIKIFKYKFLLMPCYIKYKIDMIVYGKNDLKMIIIVNIIMVIDLSSHNKRKSHSVNLSISWYMSLKLYTLLALLEKIKNKICS